MFVLIFAGASRLAAAAPVLIRNHHPLLNSPLFNTPLSPPPFSLGSIFPRLFRPPKDLKPDTANLDTRSHLNQPFENPEHHFLDALTTGTASPTPKTTQHLPDVEATPSPTAPNPTTNSSAPSTASSSKLTRESIIIIPVPSITILPDGSSTTANTPTTTTTTPTAITQQQQQQSVTFLETVAFTTTVMPVVTVTGLVTLTSVVMVSWAAVGAGATATAATADTTGSAASASATRATVVILPTTVVG